MITHQPVAETQQSSRKGLFFNGKNKSGGFFAPVVQPKLTVNEPGDEYEQEADAVAERVMRMPDVSLSGVGNGEDKPSAAAGNFLQRKPIPITPIQRQCADCAKDDEEAKTVQRKETSPTPALPKMGGSMSDAGGKAAPSIVSDVLSSGGGQAMDGGTRQFMESRFGQDFSSVRIHTGSRAAESAGAIQARAYTSGRDVVFGAGEYQPGSEGGRRLLAHELTHTVQQEKGIQRSVLDRVLNPDITEEIIQLDEITVAGINLDEVVNEGGSGKRSQSISEEHERVEKKDGFIQRTNGTDEKPRKDYVFIMGSSGGFYVAARKFFKEHHSEATIVSLKDLSLAGIFAKLRAIANDDAPVGNLYIVSHANQDGTLSFKSTKKDRDKKTTFGELKVALTKNPEIFTLSGGVDEKTKIHIKGCNIGRNIEMLDALDEAFGGKTVVDAPTHKQGYEYHSEGKGKNKKVVSSEFFSTYVVEFPGKVDMPPTEQLVEIFKEKYSDLNFSDQDWEIAVMGTKKYSAKINAEAKVDKKEVDSRLSDALKKLDKKSPDYRKTVTLLKQEAEAGKADIDKIAKETKSTKVASRSKGVVRKVNNKFTTTLFQGSIPTQNEEEILKAAKKWFKKDYRKGWKFISAEVEKTREGKEDRYHYEIQAENPKTDETGIFESDYTTPAFPENDDEAREIAQQNFDEWEEKNPKQALARKDMYAWRIQRIEKKGKHNIKAFLETTVFLIDLTIKEEEGKIMDPAAVEGDTDFFGESEFE